MADLEREANKRFGSFGEIRLAYLIGWFEDAKDVLTVIMGSGATVGIAHEIIKYVATLNNSKINNNLSRGIRVAAVSMGVIGFLGRRHFDRNAELVATELSTRSRTSPIIHQMLNRLSGLRGENK